MNYRKIVLLTVLSLLISANSSCNSQILSIGQGFNPSVKDKSQVFFEQVGQESPYTDRITKGAQHNHVYLEVDSLAKYKLPYFNYLINDQLNETLQSNNILQPEIDIFNSFIKDTNTHFLYYVDEDCFFRDMKWDTIFDSHPTYHSFYETKNGSMYFMERLDLSNRVIEYKPDCLLTLHLLEKDHQELPLGYNFCKKSNLSNLENNPLIEYPCLHFENIEGRYFCCSAPWIAFKQNQTAKKSDVSIWDIETGENFKFPVKGYLSSLHILKDGVILTNYVSKGYERHLNNIHFQCECDWGFIPEVNRFYTFYSFERRQSYSLVPPNSTCSLQTSQSSNVIVWKNTKQNTIYFQIPSINLSLTPYKFIDKMQKGFQEDCIVPGNDGSWWFLCDSIFNIKELDGLLYVNKCDIPFSLLGYNALAFTDSKGNLILLAQRKNYEDFSTGTNSNLKMDNVNRQNNLFENPLTFSYNNPGNPVFYKISPNNLKEVQKFSCNSYKDLSIASVDKVLFTKNNSVILGTKVYRKNPLPIEKFGLEKAEKLLNFLQNDDIPINTLIRFTLKEAGTS